MPTFTVVTWNPCEWAVVDDHDDMDPVAIFAGPGARERAEEYAAWKNNTAAAAPCPLTVALTRRSPWREALAAYCPTCGRDFADSALAEGA